MYALMITQAQIERIENRWKNVLYADTLLKLERTQRPQIPEHYASDVEKDLKH
jgi:hypothetical protein